MKVVFQNSTDVEARQLQKIVCTDQLRPALTGVYVDLKNRVLVATDAYVLVSYPIEITENDSEKDGFIVPTRFFDRLRWMEKVDVKAKRLLDPEFVLTQDYAEVYFCGQLVYRCKYIDGNYPNWTAVFPKENEQSKIGGVAFNAKVLNRLCEALPSANPSALRMCFYGEVRAVVIESKVADVDRPVKALIMPFFGE